MKDYFKQEKKKAKEEVFKGDIDVMTPVKVVGALAVLKAGVDILKD